MNIDNESFLDSFQSVGFSYLGCHMPDYGNYILSKIKSQLELDALFLEEEEYKNQLNIYGTNPMPGRNIAEKIQLVEFFTEPEIRRRISLLLGPIYRILDYKFVVGMPRSFIPSWINKEIKGRPASNLGAYIKPNFRTCTYFSGIDYHQDIIDFPNRNPDFITIYYYLGEVTVNDAPLIILENSHRLGPLVFPHNLVRVKKIFKLKEGALNMNGNMLTGKSGDLFAWHPYILHGTYPIENGKPRISLRIIATRNSVLKDKSALSNVNESLNYFQPAKETRSDLKQDSIGYNNEFNNEFSNSLYEDREELKILFKD